MSRRGTPSYERNLLNQKIERAAKRGYYFEDIDLQVLDADSLRDIRQNFYSYTVRIDPKTGHLLSGETAHKIEQREHFNRTLGKSTGINLETQSLADNDEVDEEDLYRTNYLDSSIAEPLPEAPYDEEPDVPYDDPFEVWEEPDVEDMDEDEIYDASDDIIDTFKDYIDEQLSDFSDADRNEIVNLIDYAHESGDVDELAFRIRENWDDITSTAKEYLKYKDSKQRKYRQLSAEAYYKMFKMLTGETPTSAQALSMSPQY